MAQPSLINLIDCNLQRNASAKWNGFVEGGDGFLYGIPWFGSKILQIKMKDKSMKEIGPNFGEKQEKYGNGVRAANGSIYCAPCNAKNFLKITPKTGR